MPFKVVCDLVENGKSRLGDDWQKSLQDSKDWKRLANLVESLAWCLFYICVTRAPLLYFIRSWVALSFKVVSLSGIGNTCPDLHFVQYIKAWMSSTDPISSITNCYRLIVSYTDPVHSFIISWRTVEPTGSSLVSFSSFNFNHWFVTARQIIPSWDKTL